MPRIMRLFPSLAMLVALLAPAVEAACPGLVAGKPRFQHASVGRSTVPPQQLRLTFLGHASYLIESPGGIAAVTDFNGWNVPAFTPDVVTMNNFHRTHYVDAPDPRIPHVLRGWNPAGGLAKHHLRVGDMTVRNIATNTRSDYFGGGGTRVYGNSIFVFEAADLCVAHLSHLHHLLTPDDLEELGRIDVLIVSADGSWSISHEDALHIIEQVKAPLVVPTHYVSEGVLARFLARAGDRWPVKRQGAAHVTLTRDRLPANTEILILEGY